MAGRGPTRPSPIRADDPAGGILALSATRLTVRNPAPRTARHPSGTVRTRIDDEVVAVSMRPGAAPLQGSRRAPRRAALLVSTAAISVSLLSGGAAGEPVGDAAAGREQFAATCAACHGADASGQGSVPAIDDAVARLGVGQVRTTIEEGRGGMPAFGGTLDEQQIDDVVAHLAELSEEAAADGDDAPSRDAADHHRGPMPMARGVSPWAVLLIVSLFATAVVAIGMAVRAGRRSSGPADAPPG